MWAVIREYYSAPGYVFDVTIVQTLTSGWVRTIVVNALIRDDGKAGCYHFQYEIK